jgi:hypothetical protein
MKVRGTRRQGGERPEDDVSSGGNAKLWPHWSRKRGRPAKNVDGDINTKRATLELVRAFYKIRKNNVRQQILGMIKAVAD